MTLNFPETREVLPSLVLFNGSILFQLFLLPTGSMSLSPFKDVNCTTNFQLCSQIFVAGCKYKAKYDVIWRSMVFFSARLIKILGKQNFIGLDQWGFRLFFVFFLRNIKCLMWMLHGTFRGSRFRSSPSRHSSPMNPGQHLHSRDVTCL